MTGHEHPHHENCNCGHDHHEHNEHTHEEHVHHENCGCGQHDHPHEHDENGNCILEDPDELGVVYVESHLHDEARVISGRLTVIAGYDAVRTSLSIKLEHLAKVVQEMGGIVGHIKASCQVKTVEMFSVTDVDVTVKKAPEQEIKINLAAIVFLVDPEEAERLVNETLNAVRDNTAGL